MLGELGGVAAVVAVGVGDDERVGLHREVRAGELPLEGGEGEAGVDEQAGRSGFDEHGVAARSAGKDGHSHDAAL